MNPELPSSLRSTRVRKPPPSLWDFEDYREYLQLYLAHKRETTPGFSVRQFCLKARISTENYLLRIIRGQRNLGPRIVERIIETIPLKGHEAEYFRCLVDLELARAPSEKSAVLLRIESLRRKANRLTPVTDHSILRHWYLGAIWELASCEGFVLTPESAVHAVHGKISIQQAKESIAFLQTKGYLIEEGGRLVPTSLAIHTIDERADALLQMSHKEHLAEAIEAVNQPLEQRGFYGLTIAVNHERLPEIKRKIKEFMDGLQADLALDPRADRVYRINSKVFSLAETPKNAGKS
jgi:uncharacterized protein (TIGR02147 family)